MRTIKAGINLALVGLFLVTVSSNSYGAKLSYEPQSTRLTIGLGSEATTPLTVWLMDGGRKSYYLWFIDSISNGNLPQDWIESSKRTTFLNSFWPSASTMLTIRVPQEALPGVYSGYLLSKAMGAHSIADPGEGLYLTVTVPSGCNKAPVFEILSFGPEYIWPPNHSMEEVTVSGTIIIPDGCTLYEIGYSIEDEYGIYTSVGEITIGPEKEFTAYIPVEAWRNGNDKDGRYYAITLYAENEAGIVNFGPLTVFVPHDQRDKKK